MRVPPWFANLLLAKLHGITELSPDQIARLYSHYELLIKWNAKINLTSVRVPEEIVVRHYCESLFFGAHLPEATAGARILDLGSGAGFPGIPMGILRSDWQMTLVESHQRKAVFLREGSHGLGNITVRAERAESIVGSFCWIVSRAVRPMDVLLQIPRLGGRVGLLIGEDDLPLIRKRVDISWREPVRIPWGEKRLCTFGKTERSTWNCST